MYVLLFLGTMFFTLGRSRRHGLTRFLIDVMKAISAHKKRTTTRRRPYYRMRSTYVVPKHHRITQLPNEILALIFVLGAEDDSMLPIRVSHVCRAWRGLALHTPSLWRRISLDSRLHMWSHRILRAKACTLDIELVSPRAREVRSLTDQYHDVHAALLRMHLATPYIPRWRSLKIRFASYAPYLWNAALSPCCGHSPAVHAYALRELILEYPENDDTKEFALFDGIAPRLQKVTLLGVRLAWLPSLFQNLTFLDYTHHGFTRGYDAALEILRMLNVSARLQELRLVFPWLGDTLTSSSRAAPASRSVALPSLNTLKLCVEGPVLPSALTHLLAHLSLPALRALRLTSRPSRDMRAQAVFPHLRHVLRALPPLPTLARLELAHAWLDARFVCALLQRLPSLMHLVLRGPLCSNALLFAAREVLRRRQVPLWLLELVGCTRVSAEGVLAGAVGGTSSGPCVGVVYVRDCGGVDAVALSGLRVAGVAVRVWNHGLEVDLAKLWTTASRRWHR